MSEKLAVKCFECRTTYTDEGDGTECPQCGTDNIQSWNFDPDPSYHDLMDKFIPEKVRTVQADNRGRVNLGPEYSNGEVKIAVLEHE